MLLVLFQCFLNALAKRLCQACTALFNDKHIQHKPGLERQGFPVAISHTAEPIYAQHCYKHTKSHMGMCMMWQKCVITTNVAQKCKFVATQLIAESMYVQSDYFHRLYPFAADLLRHMN